MYSRACILSFVKRLTFNKGLRELLNKTRIKIKFPKNYLFGYTYVGGLFWSHRKCFNSGTITYRTIGSQNTRFLKNAFVKALKHDLYILVIPIIFLIMSNAGNASKDIRPKKYSVEAFISNN